MNTNVHSAESAALGFLYQIQYALLLLWSQREDEAIVYLETLDDVHLSTSGEDLLEQLKHSMKAKPSPVSIKSVMVWKTLRAWIDVIPDLDLKTARFHLVTVAQIADDSPLHALADNGGDLEALRDTLKEEANRVVLERAAAKVAGKPKLPHADRYEGCEALLALTDDRIDELLARAKIKAMQPNAAQIEDELAALLTTVPQSKQHLVAQRLIGWWYRQVLALLTKKREFGISRFELLQYHLDVVREIELDQLTSEFANMNHPPNYKFDGMIERQISAVGGDTVILKRSVREEWRAREERSRWVRENPARYETIRNYDDRLIEEWSDRHYRMSQQCNGSSPDVLMWNGHSLLDWTHFDAPVQLESIAPKILSPYYVRGTYQVLSISGAVGWHPHYKSLLGFL